MRAEARATTSTAAAAQRVKLGTVYGTLLNFRAELEALGAQMTQPPYQAPPKAPVLYIKPANTWSADGAAIAVPAHVAQVAVGATVAMLMRGPGDVGGYVLMNDLCVPHTSFFRPPVKLNCLDGFLGVGNQVLQHQASIDIGRLQLELRINGKHVQAVDFARLVRPPMQLLAEVSEFMTLAAGDALMLGCDVLPGGGRPLARVGDRIELSAPGLGSLTQTLVAEAA